MLFVEIFVNIIAPYPYLDSIKYKEYNEEFKATVEYNVNDVLLFFSFSRIYLLLRYVLILT